MQSTVSADVGARSWKAHPSVASGQSNFPAVHSFIFVDYVPPTRSAERPRESSDASAARQRVNEIISAALDTGTATGFRNHCTQHFTELVNAYGKTSWAPPEGQPADAFPELIRCARKFAGDIGEEMTRRGAFDLDVAVQIVHSFTPAFPSHKPAEDRDLSARAIAGQMQFTTCAWALRLAAGRDKRPTFEVLQEMVFGVAAGAHGMFTAVLEAATLRGLRPRLDREIALRWFARPCEAMFEHLAQRSPALLADFANDTSLSNGLRALAAQAAGLIPDAHESIDILLPLLDSAPPVVQEHAVYGLERHLQPAVIERLRDLVDDGRTSEGVREAAREVLDLS